MTKRRAGYQNTKIRRARVKLAAIQYKGGECSVCKQTYHPSCMEFHHLDPLTKSFEIGGNIAMKSWEIIKLELDKCVLLCANCHRTIHSNEDEVFWDIVKDYKGDLDLGL